MAIQLAPIAGLALRYGAVALATYAATRAIPRGARDQRSEDALDRVPEGATLRRDAEQVNATARWTRRYRFGSTGPAVDIDAVGLGAPAHPAGALMQLLGSPASPFVRKVLVLLAETGQDDVAFAPVTASPLGAEAALAAANPLGKIPALVRPSGPTLYDSRVITRFLDHRAQSGLYPEARLWDTLTLEATADGIMDAAVISVYEKRARPAEKWHQPWLDGQWDKVTRALDVLESRWISHLAGPLDMGQIAVACALGYLDFRHSDKDWRPGRDALASWYTTFAQRPSMTGTEPPKS